MLNKADLIEEIAQHELAIVSMFVRDRSAPLLETTLTIQQLKVLVLLHIERSLSSHALAEALGVGLATVTGIVDRLVDRDLVSRSEDQADRRVRRITLTSNGQQLTDQMLTAGDQRRRSVLERLPETVLADLARVMAALRDAAAELVAEESAEPSGRRPA